MTQGITADETVERLTLADEDREHRQVGAIDARGRAATFTGFEWAGGVTGDNYAAQGDILVGGETVEAMARTYEETGGDLAARLLSAIPVPDPQKERQRVVLTGDVPSPAHPPEGCSFHTRCPRDQDSCTDHEPGLEEQEKDRHKAACFFPVLEGHRIEEPATSTPE